MLKMSLAEAENRAKVYSLIEPDLEIRVLYKEGCSPHVNSAEWVYKQLLHDGYYTVCRYKNGVRY